ncbi:hypothetical protein Bca101_051564 [Brassica carinata]
MENSRQFEIRDEKTWASLSRGGEEMRYREEDEWLALKTETKETREILEKKEKRCAKRDGTYMFKYDSVHSRRKYHELKVKDERPFGIRHCQSSQSSMAKEANNGDLLQFRVNPCPCWSHNIPLDSSAIASSFFYAASHSYWDYIWFADGS